MTSTQPSSTGSALVREWFRYVWQGRPGVLGGLVVLSLVNAAAVTTVPWLWQFVVDEIRGAAETATIVELAIWIAVVGIVQAGIYVSLQATRTVMNARIQWRARERVTNHIVTASKAFFRQWETGDVVTRISDDAGEKTAWFLCSGIFRGIEALAVVTACFSTMLYLDPLLALTISAPLPLLILWHSYAQGVLEPRFRKVQSAISELNNDITATFAGIRVVQGCRLEAQATARFAGRTEAQRGAEVRATMMQQAIMMAYGYGWQLAIVALLLAGGHRVIDGTLTLGEYVTMEALLMTMVWPMFDFGTLAARYKQAGVSFERLQAILDEAGETVAAAPLPDVAGIAVTGADVHADDGTPLLTGVDFKVARGSTVAIVGAVGAGKSILMELLAGARSAVEGVVTVEGRHDGRLAYVPQDPVILSTSLRDNIVLGSDVSTSVLDDALNISRLAQDLEQLPDGLETVVGERGVTLSGGQKQRVALARALAALPTTMLLDDATAALDADTEATFWNTLAERRPDTTAVVVTHRIATIERADTIIVMEDGRVAQRGSHADLLDVAGPYRDIYGRYQAQARIDPDA